MLSGMTEEDREDAEQEFYEVKGRAEILDLMLQNQDIFAGFLAAGFNALWLGMGFSCSWRVLVCEFAISGISDYLYRSR